MHEARQELAGIGSGGSELVGDDRLLTALASGCHVENAAQVAGISPRTAYRRLADPEFRSRLDAARESLRESILAKLVDAGHDAIGTLWTLMHESEDDGIKLRAAKTLIDSLMASHSVLPKTKTTVRTMVETCKTCDR
jgi:HEAT repeat protein